MIREEYKRIHFVGIGGVSMSSLARYCLDMEITVSGSDATFSDTVIDLIDGGCRITIGTDPLAIGEIDLLVYSGAIPADNEELVFYKRIGTPCIERNVFLSLISKEFRYCIAVSGTHGKTTVTSMLMKIFYEDRKEFYGHVGGETVDLGGYYYSGKEYMITEACEYRKSMLSLSPKIGVVTNVEYDHPDTYADIDEVYSSFDEFLSNTARNKGLCVVNGDCDFYKKRHRLDEVITYGKEPNNRYRCENVYEYKNGYMGFLITDYGTPIANIKLSVPGEHNVDNALCSYAVARSAGIKNEVISRALASFRGVKRRFEYVAKYRGCDVYTDYAHHPKEIAVTLTLAKSLAKRIFLLFQPHTYSRTKLLFDEFLEVLNGVEYVVILKEYPAREKPSEGKSAKNLYDNLTVENKYYCENIIDAVAAIDRHAPIDSMILVMGAGDIANICKIIKE